MAPMIIAEGIAHTRRGPGGGIIALDGISFSLGAGECLGILGGGGAGKSTLASIVAGLLVPSAGRLSVGGVAAGAGRRSRTRLIRMVGYAPQRPERQLFARTVAEDVAAGFGTGPSGAGDSMAKVVDALARVGLPSEAAGWPIASLPRSQARLTALAGVLVNERPVIVLDEPAAGLDAPGRLAVTRLLEGLRREGRTLVVASCRPGDLLGIADRLMILAAGRVVFDGPCVTALERDDLPAVGAFRWPPQVELLLALRRMGAPLQADAGSAEEAVRRIRAWLQG